MDDFLVTHGANERPPVDAGTALGFAIESHWPGTTEAGCYLAVFRFLSIN
jgi:hypothetical protein